MSSSTISSLVAELVDDFLDRQRRGELPSIQEYVENYPDLATEILEVFPAVAAAECAAVADKSHPARLAGAVAQVGDFRLIREIGRGGMGVVYEAEQISLGRQVALKLIPERVVANEGHRQRFLREAQTAARLNHTNIVPVFGFGAEEGIAYYAMKLIRGQGLDAVTHELKAYTSRTVLAGGEADACGAAEIARSLATNSFNAANLDQCTDVYNRLPTEALPAEETATRVSSWTGIVENPTFADRSSAGPDRHTLWRGISRLGVQAACALDYAHQQGVLHRDVKPSNLLLDVHGNLWVTDFGLAKAEGLADLTRTGDVVGTLRYMPPEAFQGRADARSDVYSLGLTLFELLALRPAFDEWDQVKLVGQTIAAVPPPLKQVAPGVPRDLATIIDKAIESEPDRRYQSAAALADDLQRYLDGRPITARPATEIEKLWMWARRRPAMASLVAAVLLSLSTGSVVSTVFAIRAARFADDAEGRAQEASFREKEAIHAQDEAHRVGNAAARQAAALLFDKGIEDARNGQAAEALHLFVRALQTIPEDDSESGPLEHVIRANLASWSATISALEHVLPGGPDGGDSAFSPNGELLACRVAVDEIRCFRTDTGAQVGVLLKHPLPPFSLNLPAGFMTFAADGKSVWLATGAPESAGAEPWAIYRFDPLTGENVQPPILGPEPVGMLTATPDGRFLAGLVHKPAPTSAQSHPDTRESTIAAIVTWNAVDGRVVRRIDVENCGKSGTTGISPDGKTVTAYLERKLPLANCVCFSSDGSGSPQWSRVELRRDPTFRPDLRAGLSKDEKNVLSRWSITKDQGIVEPGASITSPFNISSLSSPDGRSAVRVSDRRILDIGAWPPRPSGLRFSHPGTQALRGLYDRFSPDARFVVTGVSQEGKAKWLWRMPRNHSRPPIPIWDDGHPSLDVQPAQAALDSGRTRVILRRGAFNGDDVRVVDLATGAVRGLALRHGARVEDIAFSCDGEYFATASFDGTARVWHSATGRAAGPSLAHPNYVAAVAFHPEGNLLAAGDFGPRGRVILWDWRKGEPVGQPMVHDDIVLGLGFSPDGRYLAAVKSDDWSHKPEIWVWEVASGTVAFKRAYNRWRVDRGSFAFRPDGRGIAVVDADGVIHMWEVPSGRLLGERSLNSRCAIQFSPDERMIAIAEGSGVRLLDADTLAPLPGGHLPYSKGVRTLTFSPDGTLLLTGAQDGTAQLWDITTRKTFGVPAVLVGPTAAVGFTSDGRECFCVASDGTVRRWQVPVPLREMDLNRLMDRVALMTARRMDASGGTDFVPEDEWRGLRTRLVGNGSTALVPPMSASDWHEARAADAEQDGDTYGALWHLDRLATFRPSDWTVPARRGRALVREGRRYEAAEAYAEAQRLAPTPTVVADWLRAASADDQSAKRKDDAVWHLSRAIDATLEDWTLYMARSKLLDPDRARNDIEDAIRLRSKVPQGP